MPDTIIGYDNPSHFILKVYALNQDRLSSLKEKLPQTDTVEYFIRLREYLAKDISKHYQNAKNNECKDVIWSNEGLYLLNSVEEYNRLRKLFDNDSSNVVCVCCHREPGDYRLSYMMQLSKLGIELSDDKNSDRYMKPDSWLFDYPGKEKILKSVFDEVIIFPYDPVDMVKTFMTQIDYPVNNTNSVRLNVTKYE